MVFVGPGPQSGAATPPHYRMQGLSSPPSNRTPHPHNTVGKPRLSGLSRDRAVGPPRWHATSLIKEARGPLPFSPRVPTAEVSVHSSQLFALTLGALTLADATGSREPAPSPAPSQPTPGR